MYLQSLAKLGANVYPPDGQGRGTVALGNRCPTHHHRTQRRRLVVRLGENPCNRHLRRDQGTSSRRYATSPARALQYACVEQDTTSPTVSAPTVTRRTDHMRSTKASDSCFLVLLFLTPTVRHANIWGILRARTPSAAKIGSVFFVQSTCRTTAILGKHGHTSAWCIATALQMRLYRPPRQQA